MKIVLLIIGIICELYGLVVLAIIGAGHWFNFCFIICGAVLIGLALVIRPLRKKFKKLPKLVKEIILVILALCLYSVVSFEVNAVKFAGIGPASYADYVIVLGAKVNGTRPSKEFAVRIDAAADYWKENNTAKIVVTGGKGSDEAVAESHAARDRLIEKGVPDEVIIVEDKSVSTYGNLVYAADLIREDGGSPDYSGVVIVSSSFHLYRANKYATEIGYGTASYLGSTGLKILIPQYYAREFAATVSDMLRGEVL